MKLGTIWNSFRKAVTPLVDRVMGNSAAKAEAHVATTTAKAASPKIASFDDAMNTSRSLGQLSELGLVEPAKFAKQAKAVLDSPQSGNFAHEVTRHTAAAMKDNPNSVELLSTLTRGHKQLDKNITERMERARHLDDPAELRAIHTNNIRDARAIIDTGAPAVLRDDAFKDIAKSLDGLMATDPAAAKRITQELSKDPAMVKGVGDAARAMRAREAAEQQAHAAMPAAPVAPAKPELSDMHADWATERVRMLTTPLPANARVMPTTSARLPELSLVHDAVPMRAGATSYPSGAPVLPPNSSLTATDAWQSIAAPRQMSAVEEYAARASGTPMPNIFRPTQVEGIEVREIDMSIDAFKALQAEASKAAAKPAAAATATGKPLTLN